MRKVSVLLLLVTAFAALPAAQSEKLDSAAIARIRDEGLARSHHSNMDTYDRVQRDDLVQQGTIAAVFAYNAAMRDQPLPRKALPPPQRGGRGSAAP